MAGGSLCTVTAAMSATGCMCPTIAGGYSLRCGPGGEMVDYVIDRKGHDRRYSLDISKARDELGYLPRISFDTGLASTIDWYHANRSWWEPLRARAATL